MEADGKGLPGVPGPSKGRLRGLALAAAVLVVAAGGVRIWWAMDAPARVARQAATAKMTALQAQIQRAEVEVAAHPHDPSAYNQLASAYAAMGNPDWALSAWRKGRDVAPGSLEAWQWLANGYLSQKRFAAAEELYQEIARRWPTNAAGSQGLAVVYRHTGRLREALTAARQAARLESRNPVNDYVLGAIVEEIGDRAGYPQSQLNLLQEGYQHLKKAERELPHHPDVEFRLGRLCLLLKRVDEAKKALEEAVQVTPDRTSAWLGLGQARLRSGDVDGAIAAGRRACAVGPADPEAHLALGRALLLKSDKASLEEAASAFAEAVRLDPSGADCQERLGTALLRLGEAPQARAAFEQSFRLDPNNAYPVQQLAQIYRRMGDNKLAVDAVKQAEALAYNQRLLRQVQSASSSHPKNPKIHLSLADRYRELGWLPQAEDEYQVTLSLAPGDKQAQQGLAETRRLMAKKSTGTGL